MTAEALIEEKPREQGGAQAYRAFDFQVHASMRRILEAHRNGETFSAYFDFFDDLIFVHEDRETAEISFFQVKSRAGSPWTPNRLASRAAKGESPKSIVGKSYNNLHQFGLLVRKAAIISNQHLKAKYPDGKSTSPDDGEILLSELSTKDHNVLVAALELDFPDGIDPRHAEVLTYERIPLDVESFRQTLLGDVTEFVCAIDPDYAVVAKPLYEALLNEITRCTGKVAAARDLAELQRQKSLGNGQINDLVGQVRRRVQTPLEWWPMVETELVATGWQTVPLRRLRLACLDYWRARERGAAPAVDLGHALRATIDEHPGLFSDSIVRITVTGA